MCKLFSLKLIGELMRHILVVVIQHQYIFRYIVCPKAALVHFCALYGHDVCFVTVVHGQRF